MPTRPDTLQGSLPLLVLTVLHRRGPLHGYATFPGTNLDAPEDDVFSDPAFVRLRDAGRGLVDLFAVAYPNKPRVTFDMASGDRETVHAQYVSGDAFEQKMFGILHRFTEATGRCRRPISCGDEVSRPAMAQSPTTRDRGEGEHQYEAKEHDLPLV
jgi:hypothetical protein